MNSQDTIITNVCVKAHSAEKDVHDGAYAATFTKPIMFTRSTAADFDYILSNV